MSVLVNVLKSHSYHYDKLYSLSFLLFTKNTNSKSEYNNFYVLDTLISLKLDVKLLHITRISHIQIQTNVYRNL